jgi:hypothetical protein
MHIITIKRECSIIKNGYASHALNLAAHGYSPEVADINLERTIRLFLAPFEREGTLQAEMQLLGLEIADCRLDVLQFVFGV